jgi:hypothetical protein
MFNMNLLIKSTNILTLLTAPKIHKATHLRLRSLIMQQKIICSHLLKIQSIFIKNLRQLLRTKAKYLVLPDNSNEL